MSNIPIQAMDNFVHWYTTHPTKKFGQTVCLPGQTDKRLQLLKKV